MHPYYSSAYAYTSSYTYESVMSHVWMTYKWVMAHRNESCRTYKRCICAIFSPLTRPLTRTDAFCHTYEWINATYESATYACMHESCHVCIRYGTHVNDSSTSPFSFCLSLSLSPSPSLSLSLSLFLSLSLSFSLSFTLSLFFSLCLSLSLCVQIRLRRILFKWANEIECTFFGVFAYIDRVIEKDR